jgi:hypothetical protein
MEGFFFLRMTEQLTFTNLSRTTGNPRLATWDQSSTPTSASIPQLVFADLPAERIPMYPQNFRGAALVSMRLVQHVLDEPLFEFADGFVKENSAIHHLRD